MKRRKRWGALMLTMILTTGILSGCSSNKTNQDSATALPTAETTAEPSIAPSNGINETKKVEEKASESVEELTTEQKNSLNMLNYLAFISQEILSKKNNRIYIDMVYTSLLNNINPSTVNDYTEAHYAEILDRLHEFEKLLTKRDRLQYLFEQNQAQAMRNAIPNPLGLLSAVQSMNIASLVSSVVYMAVDAVSSYTSGMSAAEQSFLQDSWNLDDEESDTIHSLREQAFMYMVEVVKGFKLPDRLTLTENKVDKLVEWNEKATGEESAASRVYFYKTNESQYEGFGQYWLARAKAHYDNREYKECLKAIDKYESLQIGIYRQDYELAKVLPIAISAASQIYDDKTYIETAKKYAAQILNNTDTKRNWALRYFAAQTYIDLNSRTQDVAYLQKAFDIALENANELKTEQKALNNEYIADLQKEAIPTGTSEDKKKEIEAYNKQKEEERKTELPPVFEPLKLNMDLLYALADKLNLDKIAREEMEDILYVDGMPLFLSEVMNKHYGITGETEKMDIAYNGKELTLPVVCLTGETKISVVVRNADEETILINDWKLVKVDRIEKDNPLRFMATYQSKQVESIDYKKAEKVEINVFGLGDDEVTYTCNFAVKNSKEWVFFDKAEFEELK